jgi:hypothetical protein
MSKAAAVMGTLLSRILASGGQILGMRDAAMFEDVENLSFSSESRCLDIAGVASSILATPTIFLFKSIS